VRRPFLIALLAAVPLILTSPANTEELKSFVRGSWQSIVAAHLGRPVIVSLLGIDLRSLPQRIAGLGKLLAEKPDLPARYDQC